jgi:hypothetical protein
MTWQRRVWLHQRKEAKHVPKGEAFDQIVNLPFHSEDPRQATAASGKRQAPLVGSRIPKISQDSARNHPL